LQHFWKKANDETSTKIAEKVVTSHCAAAATVPFAHWLYCKWTV